MLLLLLQQLQLMCCSFAGDEAGGYDSGGGIRRRHGRDDDIDDYDDSMQPRTASRLASRPGGAAPESPRSSSASPGAIVALNETAPRGPSRIGATLYQAPSPHAGFTATQNVVSTSAVRPVDTDQVCVVVVVVAVVVAVVVVVPGRTLSAPQLSDPWTRTRYVL